MAILGKQLYAITLRKAHTFMLRQGFEAAALLVDTELSETDLEKPYSLISGEQARQYYLNLVNLADRDGVGLEIGWMTSLSDMGPHGMAEMTERTVGDALSNSYELRDNYNLLVDWTYKRDDRFVIHTVSIAEPDEKLRIFLLERGIATIQAHTEEMLGSEATPVRIHFDYKAPKNFEQYKAIFRCPLRFSQAETQLFHPGDWLDRNLETTDSQAGDVLGALRTNLHDKLSSGGDIVLDVRMALRRNPGEFPSLERIAEGLAMSSRTLRRKLGQHNVRYQDLLDEERQRVAEDFLVNTTLSIQQISDQCGFNDAQNFSQAFRRWRGMTPTEFRNSHN